MKRISAEEKMIAVKRRLERGESLRGIGRSMGLHPQIIRDWCRRYQSLGPEAFMRREKNIKYTLEFKTTAV
ncbi:MAG: transposase, partial [Firmicutes bacterium]|nr:transposase [Bacillota bacterium]